MNVSEINNRSHFIGCLLFKNIFTKAETDVEIMVRKEPYRRFRGYHIDMLKDVVFDDFIKRV